MFNRVVMPKMKRGFTLIELLIVVAIIAVLAAIAVPNFIEAQTRSKVSRAKNDLRVISTALDTYRTDYNGFPLVGSPKFPHPTDLYIPLEKRMRPLTTPISYLSSSPLDPFYMKDKIGVEGISAHYVYSPGNLYHAGDPRFSAAQYRNSIYSISGRGPDGDIHAGGYCMAHPISYETGMNVTGQYDPTNGTVSVGDIIRLGGSTLGRQMKY